MFICDFGSGNTCKNNMDTIERMIDALAKVDPERKIIIKWQLFNEAGDNEPLQHFAFSFAYNYAKGKGFKTTASVFDKESLDHLLLYDDIPFVKIANRPDLYWLIGEVPRKIPVIVSKQSVCNTHGTTYSMCCISKYPCTKEDYQSHFSYLHLGNGISDHTANWDLFKQFKPEVYECHFKLSGSSGLDAGDFARTPEQIKEIYEEIK